MDKHDQTFMGILQDQGQAIPFLDSMFGFLYRCTDFFRLQTDPNIKIGFPPGVAEQVVIKVLRKWEAKARLDDDRLKKSLAEEEPHSIREEVVEAGPLKTERDPVEPSHSGIQSEATCKTKGQSAGDCYNGAVRSGYQWSQTISDLDVQVTVPPFVAKGKQLKVIVDAQKLLVQLLTIPEAFIAENPEKANGLLLEGELLHKTRKEESTWTLIPGREVQIHLEKYQEQWWDALLTGEEKINLQNIDASRSVDDLPQEEQMKIQELVWAQQMKRNEEVEPRHQPVAEMLKKAWNKEGSPFKGMEYNPSMINFDGNFLPDQDKPT